MHLHIIKWIYFCYMNQIPSFSIKIVSQKCTFLGDFTHFPKKKNTYSLLHIVTLVFFLWNNIVCLFVLFLTFYPYLQKNVSVDK
jgi:hypothetical protein